MTTTPSPPVLSQLIENEAQLDDLLTRPRPELVSFIRQARSPLLVLGAGGKMGPTLAALACRAAAAVWARQHGFTQQRVLTRMYLGQNAAPSDPRQQFALAGPEVG